MEIIFVILALVTLGSAIAAMTLRNLVHCALCVVVAFAGIAGTYLLLNAQFVGFTQLLVYVGAVAILIVFAVLLTRGAEAQPNARVVSRSWVAGWIVALLVFCGLSYAILSSANSFHEPPPAATVTVKQIGEKLMTTYVLPLEAIGLLLTAAMIGAVIIAMREKESGKENEHGELKREDGRSPLATSARSSALHGISSSNEP